MGPLGKVCLGGESRTVVASADSTLEWGGGVMWLALNRLGHSPLLHTALLPLPLGWTPLPEQSRHAYGIK